VQNSREIGGFLQIAATAAPGHGLSELEHVINEEIARLASGGPTTDEMERGRAQAESHFVFRLQTVGGFGGKSDQLNAYNTFTGDPGYFQSDLARYEGVTSETMVGAVRRYLVGAGRVALSIVPRGRLDLALPDSMPADVS
jgi:zinc protease